MKQKLRHSQIKTKENSLQQIFPIRDTKGGTSGWNQALNRNTYLYEQTENIGKVNYTGKLKTQDARTTGNYTN